MITKTAKIIPDEICSLTVYFGGDDVGESEKTIRALLEEYGVPNSLEAGFIPETRHHFQVYKIKRKYLQHAIKKLGMGRFSAKETPVIGLVS